MTAPRTIELIRTALRWALAALFAAAGVGHFLAPDVLLAMTPDWVPFPRTVILATGVFEIAAAAALLTPRLRMWAGIALALYSVAVWPANFKHALESIDLPVVGSSWWFHAPRLALQPVLIWGALFASGAIDWPWRPARLRSP